MLVAVGSLLRPLNSDFGLAPGEVIRYVVPRFGHHDTSSMTSVRLSRPPLRIYLTYRLFGLGLGLYSLANPDFVVAHIHLYSATLVLCNMQREDDPMMNDRAVKAAIAISNVGRHLRSGGRLELIHSNLMIMVRHFIPWCFWSRGRSN